MYGKLFTIIGQQEREMAHMNYPLPTTGMSVTKNKECQCQGWKDGSAFKTHADLAEDQSSDPHTHAKGCDLAVPQAHLHTGMQTHIHMARNKYFLKES